MVMNSPDSVSTNIYIYIYIDSLINCYLKIYLLVPDPAGLCMTNLDMILYYTCTNTQAIALDIKRNLHLIFCTL